jgi:hypothetical protein
LINKIDRLEISHKPWVPDPKNALAAYLEMLILQ